MSHIDNIREFENKSGLSRQVKHLWKLGYLKALKETLKRLTRKDKLWPHQKIERESRDIELAIKEAEK